MEKELSVIVLCTIIMVTKVRAVLTGRSTVSVFDLAWFSSVFRAPLSAVFMVLYIFFKNFCLHLFLYLLVS